MIFFIKIGVGVVPEPCAQLLTRSTPQEAFILYTAFLSF
ncbi:hypothetical protein F442_06547 [Phytophthora nicotianae P10297]|uniref:Uncharacterized protein n=3 Tax=Phytophthora nicotianae TaxID=4792 RepID=V9FH05_PHYNI|nr:hypothetical protein F443_06504 [Phytophthora nicotianae P1569]ETO78519.1 hypothetical protein F444_06566 [Phytophthora nicotianae P1976]ETP47414.1 hypothetical protein F442_06547 [Phytophthora nicotianae P10297]